MWGMASVVTPIKTLGYRGIVLLTILMLWLLSPWALASEQDMPSRQAIDAQIQALEGNDAQGVTGQQTLETLNKTREALDALANTQKEQAALEDRVNQADRQRRQYQSQLQGLESDRALDSEALGNSSLEQLEQRLGSTIEDIKQQQEQLGEVTRALISAQTLPERVQATISDARLEQQTLSDSLDSNDGGALSNERRQMINVRMALLDARIELGQRQLANSTILRDVNQVHRELLARQIDINQNTLLVLQEAINQKRRDASEQAIAEAAHIGDNDRISNPVVDEMRAQNQALAQELLRTTDRANTMIRDGINTRARLEQVRQVERTLNEQIEALRGSLLLSRVLRQQRGSLPDVHDQQSLQQEIGDLRLRQFDIGQARQALSNPSRYIEQLEGEEPLTPQARQVLLQTLEMRRDLLDQLDREYGNLLSRAIDVQLNQQQLVSISRSVRDTIEEQLFWVANGQPLGLAWLAGLPERLGQQLVGGQWLQTLESLWAMPSPRALLAVPLLILAGLMAFFRRRIKSYLLKLHDEIGRLKRDTQLHTPRAIVLNLILSSTAPLILLTTGIALWLGGEGFAVSLGRALLQLALALQVFGHIRRLLVPDGVATRHFQWPASYVDRLRRNIFWLGCSVAPVVVVASIAEQADGRLAEQPLALLVMLAGLVGMSVFMLRLILAHVPWMGVRLFRLLLGVTLAMVPLALIGMILFGYEYTALRLCGRFILTLYILALWLLVEASVVRGLAVAARRLAYRRAVTRRRAQGRDSSAAESGVELVEEPPLDMEQVNQQSLRLSKLILFLIFISVLYLVWADLLGVLSYLDNVNIGQISESDAAGGSVNVVTLADVMTALIIVGLMVVMARNLPGLLEVMVLSRLNLKQGSAYAVTSLLSYTIVGSGIVAALGALGVTWDKLQWLVAALSVGLGFGLQEIFANFISGLIILFERPIRIGDTITLGNLHGTVSRIRIRATTVTDFDRKEIIIPNKTFVTDQLINWSLTDNITRVVLTFGVAHGTDLDLAHRLLRRIADEHPRVLTDPEPQVFCMAYSQDAFNFELRVFVNELVDRLVVTDEINRRVDAEFRTNNLRVAFQQMDVWLHNEKGDKRLVQKRTTDDGRPSPHASSAHDGDPGDASPGELT